MILIELLKTNALEWITEKAGIAFLQGRYKNGAVKRSYDIESDHEELFMIRF